MTGRRLGQHTEKWGDGQRTIISEEGGAPFVFNVFFSCRNTAIDTAHGNNQDRGEEMNNVRSEPAPCVWRGRSLGLCSV